MQKSKPEATPHSNQLRLEWATNSNEKRPALWRRPLISIYIQHSKFEREIGHFVGNYICREFSSLGKMFTPEVLDKRFPQQTATHGAFFVSDLVARELMKSFSYPRLRVSRSGWYDSPVL